MPTWPTTIIPLSRLRFKLGRGGAGEEEAANTWRNISALLCMFVVHILLLLLTVVVVVVEFSRQRETHWGNRKVK